MAFKRVSRNRVFRCPDGDCSSPEYMVDPKQSYPIYHAAHGMYHADYYIRRWGTIQIDGRFDAKDTLPATTTSNFGYDFVTDKFLLLGSSGVYQMELDTEDFYSNKLDIWNSPYTTPAAKTGMVRLSDRYIYAHYTGGNLLRVWWLPLDRTGDWQIEYSQATPTVASRSFRTIISRASEAGQVWICDEYGNATLYDVDNKVPVSSMYEKFHDGVGAANGIWHCSFVRELGVFVCYHEDVTPGEYYIEVFVPEVEPYALSNPVAIDTLQKGSASRVQVTLTGQSSEPIADYPINWTLVSGAGSLSATQTLTNGSGVAEVLYLGEAPTSIQIQAEAVY